MDGEGEKRSTKGIRPVEDVDSGVGNYYEQGRAA